MSRKFFPVLLSISMLTITLMGCKSQTPPVETKAPAAKTLPDDMAVKYREDAARLVLRELSSSTQAGERDATLPQSRINFFYDLLTRAYAMVQSNDTLRMDLQEIHTLPSPDLQRILVVLKKDAEFKSNWAAGQAMTGNLYLNQLMSRYKLKIKNYRDGAIGPMLILESPTFINTTQLALALSRIDGIRSAEPESVIGDGNDITWGGEGKNRMALKFSVGAGDCPSGCIYRKYWVFYVGSDGEMDYMGTRGTLPAHLEPNRENDRD